MRKRPPSFTLTLSALLAAAALAIVLTGRGSSHQPGAGNPATIGTGPVRACLTTAAEAQSTARSAIVVTATARAPVVVTEEASGPRGIAIVTRSETVWARIRADQPIKVKRTTGARARMCASAGSAAGARTAALRAAYARALVDAHALATRQAAESLAALLRRQYPRVLAQAEREADARAHRLALAARPPLAAQARTQARRRAGV